MFNLFKRVKPLKVGLALGGGAARGFAHIGVLNVLREHNIPINMVAGTSAGSIVGALYAAGEPLSEIERTAKKLSIFDVMHPSFSFKGLSDSSVISKILRPYLKNKKFSDLKIPFAAIATELATGKEVVIRKGPVMLAVQASSSYPIIYTPTKINNKVYIDGGFTRNVPVIPLKKMGADFIIAVDVIPDIVMEEEPQDAIGIMNIAQDVLLRRSYLQDIEAADVVIKPIRKQVMAFEIKDQEKLIKLGEKAAREKISEIKRRLGI
ncbi:patatin-like phospholipase family protein [Candidatus Margulisiibacteriota bacterium]